MNQELFLRRRGKVHVPAGTGRHAGPDRLGRPGDRGLSVRAVPALIERLGQLSAQELTRWLREVIAVLRRQTGAHVRHQPLYPDFPEQVLAASKAQRYLTAVMHYLTLRRLPQGRTARPALLEGQLMHRVIEPGSAQEFESLLEPLVASRSALSEADAADVVWFIRQYRGDVFRLLPEAIALREIRALVGGALLLHVDRGAPRDAFLQRHIETATDVLRLAVALSGETYRWRPHRSASRP